MAGITFSKKDLVSLIDHHIAILKRFGISDEAPFSIIYFSLRDKEESDSAEIFQKILRQTDALFKIKNTCIVMLTGTDWNGSSELLAGIQEFLDQKIQDNIVTYPENGEDANTLLKNLQDLVKVNCSESVLLQ